MKCKLCRSGNCYHFAKDSSREYVRCDNCTLVFVQKKDILSSIEEKSRYALHDNTIGNRDYVNYLNTFADNLTHIPVPNPKILDFGSGENSILTNILVNKGIDCIAYDPLYDIGNNTLNSTYDIIIMCEVIEHLKNIQKEVSLLSKLLSEIGYILIRTELLQDNMDFTDWWYTKDPTHINFFSAASIKAFGELLGKKTVYSGNNNIIILH